MALSALLLAAAPASRAEPPLRSETADAAARGRCELETALARTRASAAPTLSVADAIFACGVSDSSQAGLGYTREREQGKSSQAVRAVGKTVLRPMEGGHAGLGVRYGVEFARSPGLAWRADGIEVLGLYSREVGGGLLLHANLGHGHSRSARQGTTLWSLGVETTGSVVWAADVFGDDRQRPGVSAGVGHKFNESFGLSLVASWQFSEPRTRTLTLGAKLSF